MAVVAVRIVVAAVGMLFKDTVGVVGIIAVGLVSNRCCH